MTKIVHKTLPGGGRDQGVGIQGWWGSGGWGLGVVGVKGIGGWGTRGDRVKEVWGPGAVELKGVGGDQGVGVDRMGVKGRRSKVVEI